jgi:hypothetical protein
MLRGRRRWLALAVAALVAAVIVVVLLAGGGKRAKTGTQTTARKPSTATARLPVVSVDPGVAGATIADGFLGLSIE